MTFHGEREIRGLIQAGVLRFARLPAANPGHLDFPSYTVPLVGHDYPARTPALWNRVYQTLGMDLGNVMLVGDPTRVPEILDVFRRDPRYLGGGLGVGFKEAAVPLLDELDPLAASAGAVNILVRRADERLRGHNTDGEGFAVSLEAVFARFDRHLPETRVVCLGAGGTACAIALALAARGVRVTVVNRTAEKAARLAARVNAQAGRPLVSSEGEERLARALAGAHAVVNTTLKGSHGPLEAHSALGPAEVPASAGSLRRNLEVAARMLSLIPDSAVACDIVLTSEPTPFLRAAAARGLTILDGVPMVIHQSVEAFWVVHGLQALRMSAPKEQVRAWMTRAATE